MLAGAGADIDDPVGAADDVHLVLDDEQRIADRLQPVERAQQRLGIGGMQPGRRLVHHIDDAEQVGDDLGGKPQPLQLARRQRRRAAFQRQIAEAEVEQHRQPAAQIAGDALDHQRLLRMGLAQRARACRPSPRHRARRSSRSAPSAGRLISAMSRPSKRTDKRLPAQPLAVADRARPGDHEARGALLHHRALGGRIAVGDMALRAREGAHVAGLDLAPDRALDLVMAPAGIDRDLRLLLGEQDPVAHLLRQLAPRRVDVDAEADQDVAQVLAAPGHRPGGDGALADGQEGSGTIEASVTSWIRPRPWQRGQAPSGVLGEKDSASRWAWPGG